jgi:hypothetical protein
VSIIPFADRLLSSCGNSNTTDTAVTHHSLVSAVTQASASSSNPYQSTDNDDTADYRDISPYNPNTYKCQDYGNDQYQWFDGLPGGGKDQEFTIDLKDGSMDRSVFLIDMSNDAA